MTHFCAPGFFFLMGVGMALFAVSRQRQGWSKGQIIRHFLIRGAAILAIKLLLVNRAWELSQGGGIRVYIGVLFALGINMILGSFLLWIKPKILFVLAAFLLIGAELVIPDPSQWGQRSNLLRALFLVPGGIVGPNGEMLVWSNYPALPWLELVVFGMAFGRWLAEDPRKAYSRAWKLGLAFLAVFVVVRLLDGFGNIRPRLGDSWMDFLNPVKYPPSITFTLMTTGVNLLFLWLLSQTAQGTQRVLQPLVVFGQTPLFFYVLHLFLYAGLGVLLASNGASLPAMLPVWLLGLAILYPLCLLYGKLKRHKPARLVLQFL